MGVLKLGKKDALRGLSEHEKLKADTRAHKAGHKALKKSSEALVRAIEFEGKGQAKVEIYRCLSRSSWDTSFGHVINHEVHIDFFDWQAPYNGTIKSGGAGNAQGKLRAVLSGAGIVVVDRPHNTQKVVGSRSYSAARLTIPIDENGGSEALAEKLTKLAEGVATGNPVSFAQAPAQAATPPAQAIPVAPVVEEAPPAPEIDSAEQAATEQRIRERYKIDSSTAKSRGL